MQTSSNGITGSGTFTGLSLDGIFLIHFLNALERLQIILGEGGTDEEARWIKANLQFEYLKALLPVKMQEKVDKVILEREAELRKKKEVSGEYAPQYLARMRIVTEITAYLTQSLDLTHDDIIACLTPEARAHAIRTCEVVELV